MMTMHYAAFERCAEAVVALHGMDGLVRVHHEPGTDIVVRDDIERDGRKLVSVITAIRGNEPIFDVAIKWYDPDVQAEYERRAK